MEKDIHHFAEDYPKRLCDKVPFKNSKQSLAIGLTKVRGHLLTLSSNAFDS